MSNDTLIEVKNLKKYFSIEQGIFKKTKQYVKAVDDVSFYIKKGETLGLVGESGCGKSTLGRTLTRLYEPTGGEIIFGGKEIGLMKEKDLKDFRKRMQVIFQDPYASLNPNMTVSQIISEPMDIHNIYKSKEKEEMVYELLEKVGLNKDFANRYPYEFSGGQRQRLGIARALSVKPEFIFCDEPISALDVSVQAQVINLLEDLQNELGITYLFIAHDLSMVRHISNRIGVMYLGKLVEIGEAEEVYKNPIHPYTKALISSIPIPDPDLSLKTEREILMGDVPSPLNPPAGCRFRTRCKYATEQCKEAVPIMREMTKGHNVACHIV